MHGLRLFLLCAIVCVQVKYSLAFKTCGNNTDCPDNAKCVSTKCVCDPGYDAMDLPITAGSNPITVCRDFGVCSETDQVISDCGTNGYCVTYTDQYGGVKTACKCKTGYYGLNCDRTTSTTVMPPMTTRVTTKRPGNLGVIIPAIGGGVLLLALLAGGAAALASSSG